MKRVFDVSLILLSLPVLLPLLVVVGLLVRVKLGAPVLFKQVRPGLAGKPFTMMKFKGF
ncbi:MAG: sugar transferase [Moraxella osloensis]|nr:sugar transferase [Moraxella osloensis]